MTKILNPKECLKRFIEGKIQHNRDLYEAGSKNLYFEWEDFGNDILNQEELLESYVKQCSELRMANESLKRDIERLNNRKLNIEYDNIIKNKDELVSQLESLKEEAIYMLKNPNHDEVFPKRFTRFKNCYKYVRRYKIMSVIKEANILNEIPLSIVKAGQIVQVEEDGKTQTYLVISAGQERRLVPVLMHSWRSFNIYDVEQPNIIRVFDNKAKGKCLYVKKSILEEMENEKDI